MNIISEKKLDNAVVELEIEVPVEKVEQEYKAVFNKIQRNAKIDGFRKGKAPLQMVETRYKDYAGEEVAENLARTSVIEAMEKASLAPITEPKFHYTAVSRDESFKFKAFFEVMPTVELGTYTGIKAEEPDVSITEIDVDGEIDAIRERQSQIEPAADDAVVENGLMVKFKLKRIDDIEKEQIEQTEFRDYSIVVGKSKDEYSMDKHILGMKKDEEKEISQSYPETYHIPDFAGKTITYLLRIAEISKVILPELTDEFAVSSGFDNVADMKQKTRDQIENYVKERVVNDSRSDLMDAILENSKFDIPESMVLNEMYSIFDKTQQRIGYRAESLEQFAMLMGMDANEYREKLRDAAVKSIKHTLVLSEVAKKESLAVSDEKFNEQLEKLSKAMSKTTQEIEEIIEQNQSRPSIENDILLEMSMDFIYDKADINKGQAKSLDEFVKSKMGQ
ncbi:MAG TPA: trigger factor [Spirochaetota bacterium]|nr:trigger factor [Spirochaetota bacterium]HPJ36271.1 trigger factor [Spirochaetota bacterium]